MSERASRLAKAITIMGRAFRQETDSFLLEAYTMGLEGIPIEAIEAGVKKAIGTCKFMPSPVELKELVGMGEPKSLKRPGSWKCRMCGVTLSHPESLERGYCGPHWRKIGGLEEDNRLEGTDTLLRIPEEDTCDSRVTQISKPGSTRRAAEQIETRTDPEG